MQSHLEPVEAEPDTGFDSYVVTLKFPHNGINCTGPIIFRLRYGLITTLPSGRSLLAAPELKVNFQGPARSRGDQMIPELHSPDGGARTLVRDPRSRARKTSVADALTCPR
ncbi:hypothetical protein ACPSM1_19580 [Micromonospora chersina]|uniref:hypothetical protein n=1 Tax=Micromonospora chersina TaxID=47854 RepID=UPI003CB182D4